MECTNRLFRSGLTLSVAPTLTRKIERRIGWGFHRPLVKTTFLALDMKSGAVEPPGCERNIGWDLSSVPNMKPCSDDLNFFLIQFTLWMSPFTNLRSSSLDQLAISYRVPNVTTISLRNTLYQKEEIKQEYHIEILTKNQKVGSNINLNGAIKNLTDFLKWEKMYLF